ncbi:MAG: YesL family protein [Suipraeoptans sp.]
MNILNFDSPLMSFLSRVADLIMLNLLFIVCCIPIVTIGTSMSALYTVTLKMAKNEDGYMFKTFFTAFKRNFKISTILWLVALLVGTVIAIDYYVAMQITSAMKNILYVATSILIAFYALVMIYLFPYIARFENKIMDTLKNVLLISILNLPYSILLVVIIAAAVVATLYVNLSIVLPIWLLGGFSLIAFINSFIFRRVFVKYEPKDEASNDNSDNQQQSQ